MRPVVVVLAVVAAFFIWDNVANKGLYTTQVVHSVRLVTGFKLIG
jgi:hypothetical protein